MLEKIETILRDYKGDTTLAITEATTFESLDLDSLDVVELMMIIEDEFSVNIEMSEDIKTIEDLLTIIQAAA